jgi:hypothetical protein
VRNRRRSTLASQESSEHLHPLLRYSSSRASRLARIDGFGISDGYDPYSPECVEGVFWNFLELRHETV